MPAKRLFKLSVYVNSISYYLMLLIRSLENFFCIKFCLLKFPDHLFEIFEMNETI